MYIDRFTTPRSSESALIVATPAKLLF